MPIQSVIVKEGFMKKKSFSIFGALIVLCVSILLMYQNCGETGGASLFGSFSMPSKTDCAKNSQYCLQNEPGNADLLSLKINGNPQSNFLPVPEKNTYFVVSGTCADGNFSNNQIQWVLTRVKDGREFAWNQSIFSVAGKPTLHGFCGPDKKFQIQIPLSVIRSNGGFAVNDFFRFSAEIKGIDALSNPRNGNPISTRATVDAKIVQSIPEPVLDSQAGETTPDAENKFLANYLDLPSSTDTLNVTIQGYCDLAQVSPAPDNRITLAFEEVVFRGDTPMKFTQVATCNLLGSTKRSGVQHNGYFKTTIPFSSAFNSTTGQLSNTFFRVTASQVDPNSSDAKVSAKSATLALRFNTELGGRGWTLPIAREALIRVHRFVFQSHNQDPYVSRIATINDFLKRQTPTSTDMRFGLRAYILQKMGANEVSETGIQSKAVRAVMNSAGNFHTKMYTNGLSNSVCDGDNSGSRGRILGLEQRLADRTDFTEDQKNSIRTINDEYKDAIARMSSCQAYWFSVASFGVAGQHPSWKKLISSGADLTLLSKNSSTGDFECTLGEDNNVDGHLCWLVGEYYVDLLKILAAGGAPDPRVMPAAASAEFTKLNKIYDGFVQYTLNRLMAQISEPATYDTNQKKMTRYNWFFYSIVSESLKLTDVDNALHFLSEKELPFGSTYTATGGTPFSIYNPPPASEYYSGSTNARGSIDPSFNAN